MVSLDARYTSLLAISHVLETRQCGTLTCIDSLKHGKGEAGSLWKAKLGSKVDVIINAEDLTTAKIVENEAKKYALTCESTSSSSQHNEAAVSVVQKEPFVAMNEQRCDVVHLSVASSVVPCLDSALRTLRHQGVLSITTGNLGPLLGKNPDALNRSYGAKASKNVYYNRELALRILIAAVVRSAARHGKGIRVLASWLSDGKVGLVCRVWRGAALADACLTRVRQLLHCSGCMERSFTSGGSRDGDKLPCKCGENSTLVYGPAWSGSLGDSVFLEYAVSKCSDMELPAKVRAALTTLLREVVCSDESTLDVPALSTRVQQEKEESSNGANTPVAGEKRPASSETVAGTDAPPVKQAKPELPNNLATQGDVLEDMQKDGKVAPCFYYVLKDHRISTTLPKMERLVQWLREAGHRASRTHLAHEGVKTSASLAAIVELLQKRGLANK